MNIAPFSSFKYSQKIQKYCIFVYGVDVRNTLKKYFCYIFKRFTNYNILNVHFQVYLNEYFLYLRSHSRRQKMRKLNVSTEFLRNQFKFAQKFNPKINHLCNNSWNNRIIMKEIFLATLELMFKFLIWFL